MKGTMINQFKVGQYVMFSTGPKGVRQDSGVIHKLHASGKNGSAEIRTHGAIGLPSKVTRSLRFVNKVTNVKKENVEV